MNWYKVSFPPPEGEREAMQFAGHIQSVLVDTFPTGTLPDGFGIFHGVDIDASEGQAMYFSPVAARYCDVLIASRNGQSCRQPERFPGLMPIQGDLQMLSDNPSG